MQKSLERFSKCFAKVPRLPAQCLVWWPWGIGTSRLKLGIGLDQSSDHDRLSFDLHFNHNDSGVLSFNSC